MALTMNVLAYADLPHDLQLAAYDAAAAKTSLTLSRGEVPMDKVLVGCDDVKTAQLFVHAECGVLFGHGHHFDIGTDRFDARMAALEAHMRGVSACAIEVPLGALAMPSDSLVAGALRAVLLK